MKAITYFWVNCFFVVSILSSVNAQSVVTGTVHDGQGKAVEFASVLLVNASDSTQTKGVLTDTLGAFELTAIKPGTYRLRVSSIGFRTYDNPAVTVSDTLAPTKLDVISLIEEAKMLQDVVVKGERPAVERTLGKVTLNVSNSFFKTAASALEVLKRAPGLRIDPQGGITIKGSVTPVVYVDGKQLPLTAEELKNLPSEDIEQVEIISNASAQYDGETRAVINIKLKRDKTLGLKASSYVGASVNRYYGGYELGGSATYKTKRFTYYGRLGYYEGNDFLREVGERIVQTATERTVFNSDAFTRWQNRPLSYQGAIDYSISKNHTIGIMARGITNHQNDFTDNNTRITTTSADTPVPRNLPTETRTITMPQNLAVDVNYRGTLNSRGDQLSINFDYAGYQTAKSQTLRTRYMDNRTAQATLPSVLLGQFPSTITIQSIKADYSHVVNKSMKVDVGAKLSRNQTDSELIYDTLSAAGMPVRDASRSNHFLYDERIMAAYVSVEEKLNKTSFQAALRVENTVAEGNSLTIDNVVKRNFVRWLPSLQVQHKFNDNHSLSFSYARKLRRPTFYELNPFQFYTSPFEYSEGNPFLLPATRTSTELAYTVKDITLSATYRLDQNLVAQMPIQDETTKVIRYTRTNLDKSQLVAFDITAPFLIKKWWKTQHTVVAYHVRTASVFNGGSFDNRAWSFIMNGQHVFSLSGGYTLECTYDYSAPSASQFYRSIGYGTISFGLQKNVLKGAGSIQVNVADAFNLYKERFYGIFQDINVSTTQTRNIQQGSIRFTYNVGRSTFTRKNRASGSSEEEGRAR